MQNKKGVIMASFLCIENIVNIVQLPPSGSNIINSKKYFPQQIVISTGCTTKFIVTDQDRIQGGDI